MISNLKSVVENISLSGLNVTLVPVSLAFPTTSNAVTAVPGISFFNSLS